jgi:hypothetical protein
VQKGFGFAVVEGARVVDFGTRGAVKGTPDGAVLALTKLLSRYRPAVVVMEDTKHRQARRHLHASRLTTRLGVTAKSRGVLVQTIPLVMVLGRFGPKTSKHTMAVLLGERFREIQSRVPRKRKPWETERAMLGAFVAVGFAAHYLDATSV